MDLKEAIDLTVEGAKDWECIGGFLYKWKSEVNAMLLTEFEQKSYDDGLIKVGVEIGMEKGIEKGIEKGKEEGKEEERIKTICNMFALNLSPEIIARACDVSVDYVLSLKKRLDD